MLSSAYSANAPPALPSLLSKLRVTLACAPARRFFEPAKMTSVIAWPRNCLAAVSPSTQRTASMMLDLPQPFGPMMPVSGASTGKVVLSAKDLNPARRMAVRCIFGMGMV